MSGDEAPMAERRAQRNLEKLCKAIQAVGEVQELGKSGGLYFGTRSDRDAVNRGREALDRAAELVGAQLEKMRDNRRAAAP